MSATAISYNNRHTCTYGMNLKYTTPTPDYDDLEPDLPQPHEDWWDYKFPSARRCWKYYRQTQYHNSEPSAKKEQL